MGPHIQLNSLYRFILIYTFELKLILSYHVRGIPLVNRMYHSLIYVKYKESFAFRIIWQAYLTYLKVVIDVWF